MLTLNAILSENRVNVDDAAIIRHALACSPFVERLFTKDAVLLNDLLLNLHQPYQLSAMQDFLAQQNIVDEATLKRALRQLRQRVIAHNIVRDLNNLAGFGLNSLQEVMQTTTQLAEIALNTAIYYQQLWLEALYGAPVGNNGLKQQLIVVGMGKLGGCELNVSSDIDLIFVYEEAGETQGIAGENKLSNQDFFTKLAKKIIASIDEITEDGFVFRVDMRLRPFGSEGALVSNLEALEEYYQNNGREWERYAWIKGRAICPATSIGAGASIYGLLRPFIFRKYLDYGALNSMRDLKMQIQHDVNSKGLQDNIKLGRGGIREIEFIAQVFQLIRGGQDVSLQIKATLPVLNLLQNKGLLPEKTVTELTVAYIFLRHLEHRLMYVEDAQTHELPKTDVAKARIAKAMNCQHWAEFLTQLNAHRQHVQQHFDATFHDQSADANQTKKSQETSLTALWQGLRTQDDALQIITDAGFKDTAQTLKRLQQLKKTSRYLQLPALSRQRFDALMPLAIEQSATVINADITLLRVTDVLESICRRASYLALLAENTPAMGLLVKLCSASPWLANYLAQHPILLDELLDTRSLYAAPDFTKMREELVRRLSECAGDIERQMDVMRHFKHAYIFRFAAQDINGALLLETLSDYLSALADLILSVGLATIWPYVKCKHSEIPHFAVIGYGKLGGKELGYASDLDIIFLYDDESIGASETYARFAQRINNWFNSLTSAGLLYETDLQLRPDGNSGLLVSTVAAFKDYQLNKAWVWEHQAITRARFVAGDATIGTAFEQIRIEVISQQRDVIKLKMDVLAMRERMRGANKSSQPDANKFDIKLGLGGIIDVEFLVQYLVLAHAKQYPQLNANIGNIGLLNMLGSLGIIDLLLAENVANSYREYRKMQHALRLQGLSNLKVAASLTKDYAQNVCTLWAQVFS